MTASSASARTLALESTLDASAALRVLDLLERAPSHARIALDFARVTDLEPFALARLTLALAGQPPGRVRLRGLCNQHARLLAYLGLDVERLCGSAEGDGEVAGAAAALDPGSAGAPTVAQRA